MRKIAKTIAFLCAGLLFIGCTTTEDSDDKTEPHAKGGIVDIATSSAYAPESRWGNGWNLGNTLDAKSDGSKDNKGLSTETSWGMPRTTREMIDAVAAKGFKTIRIPVSWHNHIVDGGLTIDGKWLARVKEIVDWSLDAGMNVIINIHHDNMSESQMRTTYGFCVPENNASLREQSLAYIKAVWTQVAAYFKDYGDTLIFEVLNEPRAVGKSYEWYAPEGDENIRAANKIIMEYEKAALDIIRSSGGNNASRCVMIPMYAANPSLTYGWKMPEGENLIVSAHAYTPYEFTMNNKNDYDSSVENDIKWVFSTLSSFKRPVIIGETSASDKNNYADRLKWARCFYGQGKAKNIPIILWDNMVVYPNGSDKAERHGYFDRRNLDWF